ncbi:MAG: hypothetical protein J6D26_09485 [Clostridia bacterium]|nr:hypothetical protein [Clostridia bacterium]
MTKRELFKDAISYRLPKKVTRIYVRINGDSYPICPKCYLTLEREYMSYCNCCGQKLGWSDFDNAELVYASEGRKCRPFNL